MKLEITDIHKADTFIQVLQNLKFFSDCVSLTFEHDKLYVQGMDTSHISIFEINILNDWFDTYEIEQQVTLGINTNILYKILNTRNNDHKIILEHDEQNNDKLSIEFICEEKGEFNKAFHIPLMDIDNEMLGLTEMDYDLEFSLNSKKMKTIVDELSLFGDTINISFENDIVYFSAQTEAEGSMKLSVNIDDFESCSVDDQATISTSYGGKFLHWMTNFHKLNKSCTLYVQNDIPLQFKYDLDSGDDQCGKNYIRFFLAPKISDTNDL